MSRTPVRSLTRCTAAALLVAAACLVPLAPAVAAGPGQARQPQPLAGPPFHNPPPRPLDDDPSPRDVGTVCVTLALVGTAALGLRRARHPRV